MSAGLGNTLTLQLGAASANNIALSQTPTGAGNLTLNGSTVTSGVATLDVARRVLITSGGADSARTFIVTGTDRNGNVQSSTVTGVTTTGVNTALDFLTVTSVHVDAATAAAITVGTSAIASTPWQVLDFTAKSWAVGGGITSPSGTTFSLEVTFDDPNRTGTSLVLSPQQFSLNPGCYIPAKAWAWSPIVAATGDQLFTLNGNNNSSQLPGVVMAFRVTSVAGTGQIVCQWIQATLSSGP